MANDSNENKIIVLFLSANPRGSPKVHVITECNEVREEIKSARYGRHFSVEQEHQASKEKLQKYLLETNPQIVHFAGHGDDDAEGGVLLFQDAKGKKQKASAEDIAELFRIFNERNLPDKEKIRCVVLNACLTLNVANAISKHVECVVGMSNKISDNAARVFAKSFYFALASGESVQTSSALASDQLKNFDIPIEDMIAKLIPRDGKDPRWIYFQKKEDIQPPVEPVEPDSPNTIKIGSNSLKDKKSELEGTYLNASKDDNLSKTQINSEIDNSGLVQLIAEKFSKEELKTLCFEYGVDFDDLSGEGKQAKAWELILYLKRRDRLRDFYDFLMNYLSKRD
jgi:Effector-associated domain 7/CHAT domain